MAPDLDAPLLCFIPTKELADKIAHAINNYIQAHIGEEHVATA